MNWVPKRVLRDRNAALYLLGVLVSGFGTTALWLTAGIWVKSLTGSNGLAALTAFAMWAPTLVGPVLGGIADRVRRKPLLVALSLTTAALLPLLLLVDGEDRVWLVFVLLLFYGASGVVHDAAEAALVPAAVDEELVGDFNGLRMTANESMKLLAPLAAAGLYARYGAAPVVLIDAVTCALAAALYAAMRVEEPRPEPVGDWRRDLAEGARFLNTSPVLRPLVLAGAAMMLLAGLASSLWYAVIDEVLGRSPAFVGVLYTAQGAGTVVVGLLAGPLMRRLSERGFAAAGIALFGASVLLRAVPSDAVALTASVLAGAGLPCVLIAALTAVQRETPGAYLGRTAATANTLVFVPNAVALAAGAGLVAVLDVVPALLAIGGAAVAVALALAAAHRTAPPLQESRPSADATAARSGSDASPA
ncbi:MFS transporter [Streptomyces sp. NPDC050504]|uniref:MFS transporter n=1 Tax=Streptomyces sp. NPDC050504 TaxID=3365618 RepID=UPI0037B9198D